MLVVGLTGGIGSGKSTVSTLFAERGAPIIDADVVARIVTKPGQPALSAITQHFGPKILLPNGELDRSQLRQIIFSDANERGWLENLLHPLIRDEIERQIKQLQTPYCILVIPLLFETTPYPFIDRILVIDIPESMQAERASRRDRSHKSQIETIMHTQAKRIHRLAGAHDVITNDGLLTDLIPQVDKLHQMYTKMGAA